jgi:hypothetical protein
VLDGTDIFAEAPMAVPHLRTESIKLQKSLQNLERMRLKPIFPLVNDNGAGVEGLPTAPSGPLVTTARRVAAGPGDAGESKFDR